MKVLLTAANGQLAQDIRDCWTAHQVFAFRRDELDITCATRVDEAIQQLRPDAIVNPAAFHFVDQCEDRWDEAFRVNVTAVANLAQAAQKAGAILVQFSTDYVFDGAKRLPYLESDPTGPLSTYAESRLAGEWMARHYCERCYVIRTCGLYGTGGATTRAGNFVETMLRLAQAGKSIRVVCDQIVTPTSTRELALKLAEIIPAAPFGIYHMTNTGVCSWYEFAEEVFRRFSLSPELSSITSREYGARARRPAYSVLENAQLRAAGVDDFSPWQEALAEYVARREKRS